MVVKVERDGERRPRLCSCGVEQQQQWRQQQQQQQQSEGRGEIVKKELFCL